MNQIIKKHCLSNQEYYKTLGRVIKKDKRWAVFIDNGADILAVCHSDFVSLPATWGTGHFEHQDIVIGSSLDDRLGCAIILDILPKLKIKYDILITTDEELGRSTADMFTTNKKYKWAFSFDRAGTDIVLYEYDGNDELVKDIKDIGGEIGQGSFSDICSLDIGCSGINFGTGYYNQHHPLCYAVKKDIRYMIKLFIRFYRAYKDKHYDIIFRPMPDYPTKYYYQQSYYMELYCPACAMPLDSNYICCECGADCATTALTERELIEKYYNQ